MSTHQTPDIGDVLAEAGFGAIVERVMAEEGWVCNPNDHEDIPQPGGCLDCDGSRHVFGFRLHAALAPVLAAAVREAEQRAWDDETVENIIGFVRTFETGEQAATALPVLFRAIRADRITEPVSHEAATSGEEASKA